MYGRLLYVVYSRARLSRLGVDGSRWVAWQNTLTTPACSTTCLLSKELTGVWTRHATHFQDVTICSTRTGWQRHIRYGMVIQHRSLSQNRSSKFEPSQVLMCRCGIITSTNTANA